MPPVISGQDSKVRYIDSSMFYKSENFRSQGNPADSSFSVQEANEFDVY